MGKVFFKEVHMGKMFFKVVTMSLLATFSLYYRGVIYNSYYWFVIGSALVAWFCFAHARELQDDKHTEERKQRSWDLRAYLLIKIHWIVCIYVIMLPFWQ